ncbi:antibiotic biosynthesis monooxygenase [Companilactobacillus ginsenosidimutans]|uniref:antibiotic biosynthesis monooxygenase n=1 Tax=Companilactobacillus ginsenosidimutans TaxID=1007676 RepID=UPI0006603C05|nr:antibiotic biosynthesis monooxygenase [Companilactobacillus ginsenosidimutans]
MAKLINEPLFRLFKLKIKEDKLDEFAAVGKQNLLTSIKNESGTLGMYTGHIDDTGIDNCVIELYKDEPSYQVHANSPQFKAFREVAGDVVVEQSVVSLTPLILVQEGYGLKSVDSKDVFVSLTEFQVDSADTKKFQSLLSTEIHKSIDTGSGTITLYLGQEQDDNSKLILFEVFEDEPKYKAHLQSEAFQQFINEAKSLIKGQQTDVLHPDVMVNHGELLFEK